MAYRCFPLAAAVLFAALSLASAQQPSGPRATNDLNPHLSDIMEAARNRHLKLWFAGKDRNWNLAAYEIAQLRVQLEDAAALYPRLPVTNITTMGTPLAALLDAVKAKNAAEFTSAFTLLTAGCNSCHQSLDRGYIAIQQPAANPFSNQSFEPKK